VILKVGIFIFVAVIFTISAAYAQVNIGQKPELTEAVIFEHQGSQGGGLGPNGSINFSTYADIWITDQSNMDNVPDLYPTLDTRYLELDASNDPITGNLEVEGNLTLENSYRLVFGRPSGPGNDPFIEKRSSPAGSRVLRYSAELGHIISRNADSFVNSGYTLSLQSLKATNTYLQIMSNHTTSSAYFGTEENIASGLIDFTLYNEGNGSIGFVVDGASVTALEILADTTSKFFGNTNHMGNNITNFTDIDLNYIHLPMLYEQAWWNLTYVPEGMYWMNGTLLDRDDHAECFTVLGLQFGNTSTDNFRLPDVSGRNLLYYDGQNISTVGFKGGEYNHTQTLAELVPHTHEYSVGGNQVNSGLQVNPKATGVSVPIPSPDTGSAGGGQPFNVLDPYTTAAGRIMRC
jgi:microcystin-dependent protein